GERSPGAARNHGRAARRHAGPARGDRGGVARMVARRLRLLVLRWIALAALALACAPAAPATSTSARAGGAPAARPLTKVVMAQTAVSPASWPVYVASARGFFEQEGLDTERVELPSSATQTQA